MARTASRNRQPAGAALVLLHVIAANPRAVITVVRKLRALNPGILATIEPHRSLRASPGPPERQASLR